VLNYLVLVLMISSQKYYSKVFILQFLKKKFDRKVYILFIKKKSKISICHHSMFNSVLNMRKIFSYCHFNDIKMPFKDIIII